MGELFYSENEEKNRYTVVSLKKVQANPAQLNDAYTSYLLICRHL